MEQLIHTSICLFTVSVSERYTHKLKFDHNVVSFLPVQISVSSGGMLVQKLRIGNLQSERGRYDGTMVYAQHKVRSVKPAALQVDSRDKELPVLQTKTLQIFD